MAEEKVKEMYQDLIKQLNAIIERQNEKIDELEKRVKVLEKDCYIG